VKSLAAKRISLGLARRIDGLAQERGHLPASTKESSFHGTYWNFHGDSVAGNLDRCIFFHNVFPY
jgi:hypothetical protein